MPLPALLLVITAAAAQAATVIYVDPTGGDDAHSGATKQLALRSLPAAQQVVRERRAGGEAGAVSVLLAGGMYELPSGLRFDSPLDGGLSAAASTTWAALDPEHAPQLVGGMSVSGLKWQHALGRGHGVWQASLPPSLRRDLAMNVSGGAGRLGAEIVELQYSDGNSSRRRLWRARHPNLDHTFPTIWGGGYLTASGGIGSLPCAFRSPRVTIATPEGTSVDCALPADRSFPGEPPRGMKFETSQLSGGAAPPLANWTVSRGIVHVSTFAQPPDQGNGITGNGYAWVQNNLQYTIGGIRSADGTAETTEVDFELGGQQVNSYSWVLGAANIQNGSRWFIENVPELLDAPSEFWHDVEAGLLYVRPPAGVADPSELEALIAITAQRLLDVGRRTSAGVSPISHLHFKGLELSGSRPTFLEEYEVPYRGDSDWTIHRPSTLC
jgi:hypothetical protein